MNCFSVSASRADVVVEGRHDLRALAALDLHRRGKRFTEIAAVFGVTRERARQLAKRGRELERIAHSSDPWDELSVRVRHCLIADGCEPTLDGVEVYRHDRHRLRTIPYFGKACLRELNDWLERHGREPL